MGSLSDMFISKEQKRKIEKDKKEAKKHWENIKKELKGTYNEEYKQEMIKKEREKRQKELDSLKDSPIELRKYKMKENAPIFHYLIFNLCLIALIGMIVCFVYKHVFLGILLILLIPTILYLYIHFSLKYIHSTFKDHYQFLVKKYGKEKLENFYIGLYIGLILLMFLVLAIVLLVNKDKVS